MKLIATYIDFLTSVDRCELSNSSEKQTEQSLLLK